MLESFFSIGDTFLRIPFLLFVELVSTKRISFIYHYAQEYSNWISDNCSQCLVLNEFYISFLIAVTFVLCIFTSVMYVRGVFIMAFSLINVFLIYVIFVNYTILLNVVMKPFLAGYKEVHTLVQWHFVFGFFLFVVSFLFLLFYTCGCGITKAQLFSIGLFFIIVPFITILPAKALYYHTDPIVAGADGVHVSWKKFVDAFFKPTCCWKASNSLGVRPSRMCLSSSFSSRWTNWPLRMERRVHMDLHYNLAITILPYFLLIIYVLLFCSCLKISKTYQYVLYVIHAEIELFHAMGFLEYSIFHLNRLNVPQLLAITWSFKVMLVIALGNGMWPVIPAGDETPAEYINSSMLNDYINMNGEHSTLAILFVRLYVGCFVHGSETWFSVFGAASLFGGIAIVVVSLFVFLIDPAGEHTAQLEVAAAGAPVDPYAWNVIEDPALALDQNDAIAVELLTSTRWNCAMVFLFLAFQADLPNLPPVYRISCCIYGIMVIAITCIHPVQALIKSILLRLEAPGRGSHWLDHIRLLFFCCGLIVAAICIFINLPHILTYGAFEYRKPVADATNTSLLDVVAFGSSPIVLKARQLRIFLSGCQLLLSLCVTLIEYGIYQFMHFHPLWMGFRPALFWTKLVSSVLDYLICLLSFFTVCWLLFYDSVGFCRLFIICCYFCFVLYPSALRAYKWLRWRLLFSKCINDMVSPSEDDLAALGDTCPICYTEMTCKTSKITRCGHLYHVQCLTQWMQRQLFCPICHADLLSSRVTDRRNLRQTQTAAASSANDQAPEQVGPERD